MLLVELASLLSKMFENFCRNLRSGHHETRGLEHQRGAICQDPDRRAFARSACRPFYAAEFRGAGH